MALASNGGVATASTFYSSGYSPSATINGDRKGTNWGMARPGTTLPGAAIPDWLQVDFAGTKTIDEIDVFTLQDNYLGPVEPTDSQTFTSYGLTDFDVQYWTGSAWATVPGGSDHRQQQGLDEDQLHGRSHYKDQGL